MKTELISKDRINSFSDAIFSIAMTLLILEIDIPSYAELKEFGTINALAKRVPSFIGFLVSFLVTAIYWIEYVRIMKFATTIDKSLFRLNILLLLFIVLMPFSTAFFVEGFNINGSFVFYTFNLALIGLINYLITRKITSSNIELDIIHIKWKRAKALNSFLFWLITGVLAFASLFIAKCMFLVVFLVQLAIDTYYKKKLRQ